MTDKLIQDITDLDEMKQFIAAQEGVDPSMVDAVYHVFGGNSDEFVLVYDDALKIYNDFASSIGEARLWIEVEVDGQDQYANCIRSTDSDEDAPMPEVTRAFYEARYLDNGGKKCPSCQSDDIERVLVQDDGLCVFIDMECHACKTTWYDIYKLKGIADLEIPVVSDVGKGEE